MGINKWRVQRAPGGTWSARGKDTNGMLWLYMCDTWREALTLAHREATRTITFTMDMTTPEIREALAYLADYQERTGE